MNDLHRDGMNADTEGTANPKREDVPAAGRDAVHVFRAGWAAEYAKFMTEAAAHLRKTAIDAEDRCFESLTNRQVGRLTSLDELTPNEHSLVARARATSHASALLSLLAIEIALKGYQIRDRGQHTRAHDLLSLFDSLNPETRQRLEALHPELVETLRSHHLGFVSLRYQFEELGNLEKVAIPKSTDPLHGVAELVVEALTQELRFVEGA